MRPEDSRHGTYAGYQQHLREGEKPSKVCPPCHEAMRRYQRVRPHLHAIGRPPRVPLGRRAYTNLKALADAGFTNSQLEDATGSAASSVHKYLREGPSSRVLRRVRTRLEQVNPYPHIAARLTHEGTIRRAQALGRIGYSASKLGPIADMHPDAIALLQRGDARASSDTTRRKIATTFQQLHMRPLDPTHNRHVSKTINRAINAGWAPPFAWDTDIDNPNAQPEGHYRPPTGRRASSVATRIADLEHFIGNDMTLDAACHQLGITRDALWKWADRHQQRHLYERLARLQRRGGNQHTSKGAVA